MRINISCAQQRGLHHTIAGRECQDFANGFYDSERNIGVVALADGAGSYQHSAKGAEAAVEAVLNYFRTNETILNRQDFVRTISQAVEQVDPKNTDVGTTLLFVVATKNGFLAGHIGDGVILKRENGEFTILSHPENGEQLWETFLLPCAANSAHFRFYEGQNPEAFLLASDGISAQLYTEQGKACPACEKLYNWSNHMPKTEFSQKVKEQFDDVFTKFSGDDKSLAILSINK